MRLPSRVRFADERLKQVYYSLEKGDAAERELFKQLTKAFSDLEENAFYGIRVPKKLIPKYYLKKYVVDNLWKCNLSKGWRLLYSVRSNELVIISIILEWLPHKEYERRFGY